MFYSRRKSQTSKALLEKQKLEEQKKEQTPLEELRTAISRIESLIEQSKSAWIASNEEESKSNNNSSSPSPSSSSSSSKPKAQFISFDNSNNNASATGSSNERNKSNNSSGGVGEEEWIELIRRVSELVVHDERASSLSDQEDNQFALFELFCEKNVLGLIVNIVTGVAFITNKETEKDFDNEADGKDSGNKIVLLPSLPIATQAIQSISILVQNVSRATSLYFLLSNNRINELICLPLELYGIAAESETGQMNSVNNFSYSTHQNGELAELTTYFITFLKSLAMRMNAETLQFFLSYKEESNRNESGTSSTASSRHFSSNVGEGNGDSTNKTNVDIKHTLKTEVDFPLYARALDFCDRGGDSFVRVTAMNICLNTIRLATVIAPSPEVFDHLSFLQSNQDNQEGLDGSIDGDKIIDNDDYSLGSSVGTPIERKGSNASLKSLSSAKSQSSVNTPLKQKTPDADLTNVDLPTRERIAIANHVCAPSRIEALVAPIFMQLTHLCGALEEAFHEMERLDFAFSLSNTSGPSSTSADNKKNDDSSSENTKNTNITYEEYNRQHKKLSYNVEDISSDLCNELMLLDDLLEVGLTSLNEQAVEMMLATFIYPSLLQPLLHYFQHHPYRGVDDSFSYEQEQKHNNIEPALDESDDEDSEDGSTVNELEEKKRTNPFSFSSISDFLVQTGMYGDNILLFDENIPSSTLPSMSSTTKETENKKKKKKKDNESHNHSQTEQQSKNNNLSNRIESSPAKASIYAILSVLYTVKNRRIIYMLLTALFHPLAPASSGGIMTYERPNVIKMKDGNVTVRVDPLPNTPNASSLSEIVKTFGKLYSRALAKKDDTKKNENGSTAETGSSSGKSDEKCIFSLSPALAYILKIGDDENRKISQEDIDAGLRANPYRRILIACLGGTDGMANLQRLAANVVDAAVVALDGHGVNNVLFGVGRRIRHIRAQRRSISTNPVNNVVMNGSESNNGDIVSKHHDNISLNAAELIGSLCVSVMTASTCVNGVWKFDYDSIAAHALLGVISDDKIAKQKTTHLIEYRRQQSLSYISTLPSIVDTNYLERLDNLSMAVDGPKGIPEEHDDEQMNLIMDRIVRDPSINDQESIIDNLEYDREQKSFWLHVAKTHRLDQALSLICKPVTPRGSVIVSDDDRASLSFASSSILAHMQLNGLATQLKKDKIGAKNFNSVKSKLMLVAVPPKVNLALQDDPASQEDELTNSADTIKLKKSLALPGSIVTLVGRAAFPCVCEITSSSAHLFKDDSSAVVAAGIKWQSLYLVIVGRRMILAEPEKTAGGNGRIVTSCLLSCLTVEKDNQPEYTSSPARRLMLGYSSLDANVPGVFVASPSGDVENKTYGKNSDRKNNLVSSQMDLWFENEEAADAAYLVLAVKVRKARSRRGKYLRGAFAGD